jgi:hypothetical protein
MRAPADDLSATADGVLVAALYSWFDAQTMDHAMPGMGAGH